MGEVVRPFKYEGIVGFIRREGGVSNTDCVAKRFGWDIREAKRRLEALAGAGLVEKVAAHAWDVPGQICSWRLPAQGDVGSANLEEHHD
jgi:hypothetical protein